MVGGRRQPLRRAFPRPCDSRAGAPSGGGAAAGGAPRAAPDVPLHPQEHQLDVQEGALRLRRVDGPERHGDGDRLASGELREKLPLEEDVRLRGRRGAGDAGAAGRRRREQRLLHCVVLSFFCSRAVCVLGPSRGRRRGAPLG